MNFTPETEDEIDRSMLLAEGTYDFEVIKAEDTVSKSGNDMIAVTLRVFAPDDTTRQVRDWLLPAPALAKKKLARFCRSVGIEAKYSAGVVTAADCDGQAGRVVLKRESSKDYGEQIKVDTYEPRGATSKPAATTTPPVPAADDCPF